VLPLIFLRFLPLRYERRAELEGLIADPRSDDPRTDTRFVESILEAPDDYRAVGSFVVPKEARWSQIVEQAWADDIRIRLDGNLDVGSEEVDEDEGPFEQRFPRLVEPLEAHVRRVGPAGDRDPR
jgi:hypothetical protein